MPINYIVDVSSKKLAELSYSVNDDIKPKFKNTLKQSLINGDPNFEIKLTNRSQFSVEMPSSTYSELLYTDFYFAYERIRQLKKEVKKLLESEQNSAWLIVTSYYTCFFAAIEIGRILGRFNLNLTIKNQKNILNNSTGGCGASFIAESPVTFLGQAKASTEYDRIIIHFTSTGGKPHKLAWDNLYYFLQSPPPAKDTKRWSCQKMFLNIIGPNNRSPKWPKPSDIRNNWNYYDPQYFMEYGQKLSRPHKAMIGNFKNCSNWASSRNLLPSEKDIASSLAFIYTCLTFSIENLKNKILHI